MPIRHFRDEVGPVYAGLLAARRFDEAAEVAAEALKHDDTGAGRAALVSWAIRAARGRRFCGCWMKRRHAARMSLRFAAKLIR